MPYEREVQRLLLPVDGCAWRIRCVQCGGYFVAARSHAKTCSDRCRQARSRGAAATVRRRELRSTFALPSEWWEGLARVARADRPGLSEKEVASRALVPVGLVRQWREHMATQTTTPPGDAGGVEDAA